jgi:hypothetical protein
MTDPRDITGDQAEFLDVLEQLALLPQPIVEDDFLPLSERALDLMEARGLVPLTLARFTQSPPRNRRRLATPLGSRRSVPGPKPPRLRCTRA